MHDRSQACTPISGAIGLGDPILTPMRYRRRSATIVICMSRACRTTSWTTVYRKRCHQGGRWERPMKICVTRWEQANDSLVALFHANRSGPAPEFPLAPRRLY